MVWWPLVALAVPSVAVGAFYVGDVLFGGYFGEAIYVAPEHDVLAEMGAHYTGVIGFIGHGLVAPPFWLAAAGVATAWFLYLKRPDLPEMIKERLHLLHKVLVHKYGLDDLNQFLFAGGARGVGSLLWRIGDIKLIDGLIVNGSAKAVGWFSGVIRHVQSGYLYHYAFAMIIGLLMLLGWFVNRWFVGL